jgi:hypothetical protein
MLITRTKIIPTRIRLIVFVALAQHVQEKHLEPHQEAQPVTFIQRWSITEAKKQQEITSAFIVTQKDTGHISVPGNPGFQQENHTEQTVKYTFYNLHNQDYEYENKLNVSAFHVSSLNKQFSFWEDTIKANNVVLNVISSGYLIPFYKTPTSVNLRNNVRNLNILLSWNRQSINY